MKHADSSSIIDGRGNFPVLHTWRKNPFVWLIASYILFALIWIAAATLLDNAILLPDVFHVFRAFISTLADGTLLFDIKASMARVFIGFIIAVVIAIPLAMAMALFSPVEKLLQPIVTLLRPIPPIAWIPLAILWFGIGNGASYFITALAAFFPIFLNSFAGAKGVEPRYLHAARFLGAGRWQLVRRVLLPAASPFIWTGIKVGLGQSWMAVVTAELVAAQSGLGFMIQAHRINLETAHVLVGMVVIGVLGSLMNAFLVYLGPRLFPWQTQ